jgi:hypothetical protein
MNVHALLAEFIDVGNQNDCSFNGDTEQSEKPKPRRDAERGIGKFKRDQCTDWLSDNYTQSNGDRKLEISVQRERIINIRTIARGPIMYSCDLASSSWLYSPPQVKGKSGEYKMRRWRGARQT